MKVATYNINNINKRLANLLAWLEAAQPDVVCLQELKADQTAFPASELIGSGYHAAWVGQKSWNGVAILSRERPPIVTRTRLPGDRADTQSRYIEAAVAGVIVASLYAPNGNPQPGPKFDYKLKWMARLKRHAATLLKSDVPVILAGDFNVAPTNLDIYATRSWDKDALIQPESRKAFAGLLAQGWTDALRSVHSDERMYTFWTYWRNRYERDDGLRLDHLLVSPALKGLVRDAGIDKAQRAKANSSDHAPAWIIFA
jgi:exodeoxyribonuclease-3